MTREADELSLRQFLAEWLEATRQKDERALERMVHDDFSLVTPTGLLVDKKELIADICSGKTEFTAQRTDRSLSLHEGGNVARWVADVAIEGALTGQELGGQYVNTATLVKTWQLVGNTMHRKLPEEAGKIGEPPKQTSPKQEPPKQEPPTENPQRKR